MKKRDHLSSRLGFIMLSAGCAIGCGNVWKFPWMCGQNGGGSFILLYILCLLILGIPVMVMELSVGRAAQTSPLYMYQKLSDHKQWGFLGKICFLGNLGLMAFYTVVTGWIIYYFVQFLCGNQATLSFGAMTQDPYINVFYLFVTVLFAFFILSFQLQKGLEKVTKYMMSALIILMLILALHSFVLSGAKEGLQFYLVPRLEDIHISTIVNAINQAFFTLSVGMGGMAIFGSYIDKQHSLLGESLHIIVLDTFVAIVAGLIIFPACYTYNVEVSAGPSLLFDTMTTVFTHMHQGRLWGTLFFLFMIFAAFSTVLGVCENILAMVREKTGWHRPKGCIVCGISVFICALTTALGFNVIHFQPFAMGTTFLDFWDFMISNLIMPLGSLALVIFCSWKIGWGWDAFIQEANTGKGLRFPKWMQFVCRFVLPCVIVFIFVNGMLHFSWR